MFRHSSLVDSLYSGIFKLMVSLQKCSWFTGSLMDVIAPQTNYKRQLFVYVRKFRKERNLIRCELHIQFILLCSSSSYSSSSSSIFSSPCFSLMFHKQDATNLCLVYRYCFVKSSCALSECSEA